MVLRILENANLNIEKHWQEEFTMNAITHEPVINAMNRLRALSADEKARYLAFVRERDSTMRFRF
jgi:phage I-like protein